MALPRIGITGHTNLTPASFPLVTDAVRAELTGYARTELAGVTCLARGSDQLFAHALLDLGGTLHVVLPAADYRDHLIAPDDLDEFDALLDRAATVHTMPFPSSGPAAYMAASEHMLARIDSLLAVWDGRPAGGYGGTADVVSAARHRGLPVTVLWPAGAARG
ncbi:hypothetical protein [Actinophytocola sp.]|uniref:hypothetical protein n=1 Tax=Actinophytocola sp. TaxID=1872138 RepID=UPI002D4BB5D3|nr:hypothetical protein [Actinophytocola sp.]HYQ61716.1 hypothetical protein [Actinophytocola sp.]